MGKGRAPPIDAGEAAAQTHALLRARAGFDINEMAAEYRALRASVLGLWVDAHDPRTTDLAGMLRFNEAIDQAICESVSFFSGEQERARNLLLGILGHDMRNPLNAIQLTAHPLNNLNAGEAVSSAAAVLIPSGARMRALLDDLTDYNRKRLGVGLHIIPSEVDLRHILEDEVQQLRSAHPDRQIISNLVVNALKYGTPGSTLRVTAKGLDDQVVFTVENRGEPITPSALANLFDPLRRGTDRLLPEEGSLGLGLSSAARLPRPTAARSKPRRPMARRRSPCAYRGPAPPKTGLLTRQFDAAQTHRAAQRAAVGLGCAAPTDGCDLYDGGR